MKIEKINIDQDKFDINLKFYYFLKYLVKVKLSERQADEILKIYFLNSKKEYEFIINEIIEKVNNGIKIDSPKYRLLIETLDEITNETDLRLFIFSLKLYLIKDLLLSEAKIQNLLDTSIVSAG